MKVYHGGTETVEFPDISKGRAGLDFGQGFYVTNLLQQAESWADRMSRIRLETALRNLSMHRPNNQLCIRNQHVVDQFLTFVESYKI